jgi:copper(I)-binding protein
MKSVLFSLLAAAFILAVGPASAHEFKAGSIEIKHPGRAPPRRVRKVAGGFMKADQHRDRARPADRRLDRQRGEIRNSRVGDGGRRDEDAAAAEGHRDQAGETVELKPGSYHLMFVGLKAPFEKGKRVKGTLQFEKAGTVEVEYAIEAAGGTPGMNHDEHKGH